MPEPFLIFGHRGSPKRFPENTLASFDEALRGGADGFETDLRLLRDGTAVLFHDDELDDVEIESLTASECASRRVEPVPLSALARFSGRCRMVLEVKRSGWDEVLVREISGWRDVVVASFDHRLLPTLKRLGATFPLGITVHGSIVGIAEYAERLGASWCFPNYRFLNGQTVASLREKNIRVVPWTANAPEAWARLRSFGCDGVITDLPEEAARWRDGLLDR